MEAKSTQDPGLLRMSTIDPQLQGSSGFSVKSWEYAAAFADSLGSLPGSVTSTVRILLTDFDNDPHNLSNDSKFLLKRFFRSRSLQSPYFHAISFFKPERLEPRDEPFTPRDFIESFSAPEHALLLSTIFLHRQARKLSDEAFFESATSWLQRGLNIGWLVGKTLKPAGSASGLLVGCYRWLGVLPFLRHDPDGFKLYARHLKTRDFASTDINFEHDRWECTSSQIGIMLLQRMGFGTTRLVPLMRATTTISAAAPSDPLERGFRATEVWIRYLLEKRTIPAIPLPPAYYLGPTDIEGITARLTDHSQGRGQSWLNCTKNDISPEKTPQLFLGNDAEEANDGAADGVPEGDAIDEQPSSAVVGQFSDDEVVAALEHE